MSRRSKKILEPFLVLFFFCPAFLLAQYAETGNDCLFSKEISLPLKPDSALENYRTSLNQTVFYSYRDQFTYWYKIKVRKNGTLTFKVSPINDSDSYSVFVYQYNADDFCKKAFQKKVNPALLDFFMNAGNKNDLYDLSEKKFKVLSGNTYYISVLNTSLNNCGHLLRLSDGSDTLRLKAIHIPCHRDISTLSVKAVTLKTKSDTLKKMNLAIKNELPKEKISSPVLALYIRNKKNNYPIECKPLITDLATQENIEPIQITAGEWTLNSTKEKNYKIKCSLLGYKTVTETVAIEMKDTTKSILLLEPLKEGDVFIMKSIYFFPNTYALKRESAGELQKLLDYLQNNERVTIEIQGYTNGDHRIAKNKSYTNLGEEWNFSGSSKDLSQKRAEAIKNFLVTHGVHATRLVPKGYGGKKPIVVDPQNNDEAQMNIRVEVMILKS